MGQKVHPISFRLGVIKTWSSRWYAEKKDFARFLHEDIKVRKHVLRTFNQAAVSKVEIERASDKIRVNIHTARPGVIIGRKGADIDRLREELQGMTGNKEIHINIKEIKNPSIDAQLISENIALQLEKRIAFRRAMKKAIQQAMDSGAKGIKIQTKGRLAGSEIARAEGYLEGKVPLHTLRADIEYGFAESQTTYGKIGVKVIVYKGDIIQKKSDGVLEKKEAPVTETQDKDSTETPHDLNA
ncbi:MAG: 30S ribosomal protein S3 [Candidatus Omnitrophica bacterium CG1_02_46_14]|nr:MAG: 30S ribosomal protein S3 [Candidatus Omnitrophica bacterium CG1_02_46_14]